MKDSRRGPACWCRIPLGDPVGRVRECLSDGGRAGDWPCHWVSGSHGVAYTHVISKGLPFQVCFQEESGKKIAYIGRALRSLDGSGSNPNARPGKLLL